MSGSLKPARPSVVVVLGTRPEAIKLAPVITALRAQDEIETRVVVTAQHRELLDEVLRAFEISVEDDLDLMRPDQGLSDLTVRALSGLDRVLHTSKADLVLVQGDTTTAFAGALAAFYRKIPVAHVEAGLRTGDKYRPFPEEINRHLVDVLSDLCFAPTADARDVLLGEGVARSRVLVTGNTVVDALLGALDAPYRPSKPELEELLADPAGRLLLVTAHRRESFGKPLEEICDALRDLLELYSDLRLVFPVHPNPRVRRTVEAKLEGLERVALIEPLGYRDFVRLMQRSHLIVTDSGGVQEEAPSLDKPVLVIRDRTERPEAVRAGATRLVGTSRAGIVAAARELLEDPERYARMAAARNPYGDGRASERIVAAILHLFGLRSEEPVPFS